MCYNKINHGQCCIAQSKRKKDIPMPYIAVTTSKALSDEQKDELKKFDAALGEGNYEKRKSFFGFNKKK